jgi:translocating chain-associated membrane protein 1
LYLQTTTPLASTFIVPKYNLTELDNSTLRTPVLYSYGAKDLCLLLFYTITCVIFHAIIQEYILDVNSNHQTLFHVFGYCINLNHLKFQKWTRKVRLSKTKASKFNESGQLFAFYLTSAAWAAYIFNNVKNQINNC